MSRYMLESDLPQYLNERFYVVRDHEGTLLGVLPDTFDAHDMIECVKEIPPETPAQPLAPGEVGYGPSGDKWEGYSYQLNPGFLASLTWDLSDDKEKHERTVHTIESAVRPHSDFDAYLRSMILEEEPPDDVQTKDDPDLSRD